MDVLIRLDSGWELTGRGPAGERIGPLAATVPGHVHTDLLREGIISDPFWRDQALEAQWIESFDWTYAADFYWPKEGNAEQAKLHFEGLDTIAEIYLNGKLVGKSSNMFVPYAFSIKDAVRPGSNRLEVRFQSMTDYLKDKDVHKYVSLFSHDRVFVRRMQCTFGWDWVHRLVSFGIWRPAYVEAKTNGKIGFSSIRTRLDGGTANIEVSTELEGERAEAGQLVFTLIDPAGLERETKTAGLVESRASEVRIEFALTNPQLWWPAGYGEQPLYNLRIRWQSLSGECWDERLEEFGIREVHVEQIPDEIGSTFTIVVNGERIFAKGGNWVPADPFPSTVTEERYNHLLGMCREGNMNMLRVWGGGIYELPAFWKACNRLGIMVSLDFMMACAQYPEEEPWFLEEMKTEAAHAIKTLRNHPCLVIWYGDNELAMNMNAEDDYWGKKVYAEVTEPLLRELDPGRPRFPTSPYLGRPFNSPNEGDCHYSAWYDAEFIMGDMTDYRERVATGKGRFLSECAAMGAPPMHVLLRMMTLKDIGDESAYIWEFRTKDNPYNGMDELTHYRIIERMARQLYGPTGSLEYKVKQMEYVQYELIRLKGEQYRRQKFSSSGLLFWMYNDCWPANGLSMMDYFGGLKAGYYAAKKSFKPLAVSVEDRGSAFAVWLLNDSRERRTGTLNVLSFTSGTTDAAIPVVRQAVSVEANSSQTVLTLDKGEHRLQAHDVLLQAVWSPDPVDGADNEPSSVIYHVQHPAELRLLPSALEVDWRPEGDRAGEIEIASRNYARVVTIDEDVLASDNYFDMAPGERKVIRYRCRADGPALTSMPKISCWNQFKNEG